MHNRWVIALLLAVCGCGGGGGGGDQGGASCPLSAALVASAGSDRTAPTHTLVQLDGSDSIVKSGKAVLFEWTLSSRPQGSAAALSSTADARPSFTPDRNGPFVLSLVVTDGRSCSAPDTLTVVAENFAPLVNAGAARTVNLPESVTLDGTGTTDPNGDPILFEWTVSSAPDGAAPTLSDASTAAPTFTPDVEGQYVLQLRASDGQAAPIGQVVVNAYRHVTVLAFGVVDAEYSTTLDRIVAVSATLTAALHLLDGSTGDDTVVFLGTTPRCVGVSPDGKFAAVGHDASVTWVDLQAASVVKNIPTTIGGIFDVVVDAYGRVFAFPASYTDHIHTITVSSGSDAAGGGWISNGVKAKLHPWMLKLYGALSNIYPPTMEAYPISGGTANYGWPWRYWNYEHDDCGDLWLSADGYRIYTRCGEVFQPGVTELGDMVYAGRLGNAALAPGEQLAWIDESVAANEIAALSDPPPGGGDPVLRMYVSTTMGSGSSRTRARVGVAGAPRATHGRFVFHRADASERYVLLSIDDATGLASDAGLVVY